MAQPTVTPGGVHPDGSSATWMRGWTPARHRFVAQGRLTGAPRTPRPRQGARPGSERLP